MALEFTPRTITSTITPEFAYLRNTSIGESWTLTWAPERHFTREQAVSAMMLDEMLSDPASVYSTEALEMGRLQAHSLGMELGDVVLRLAERVLARDRAAGNDPDIGNVAPLPAIERRTPA